MVQPKRISARLARYYLAISEARGEGYTWAEICAALIGSGVLDRDMSPRSLANAFSRTRRAVQEGRLAVAQRPLPGREAKSSADSGKKPVSKSGIIDLDDPANQ